MALRYRYVLFDFDGTLVDTSPGIISSMAAMQRQFPVRQLSNHELGKFVGPVMSEAMAEHYQVPPEQVEKMVQVFRADYRTNGIRLGTLYPGIRELLTLIRFYGSKTAIATIKQDKMAFLSIRVFNLEGLFDCVSALHSGVRDKRDVIEIALAALGCTNRKDAVMIGDSHFDAVGAQSAGIDFIAQGYGFGFQNGGSVLGSLPCVFWANSPQALQKYLVNL